MSKHSAGKRKVAIMVHVRLIAAIALVVVVLVLVLQNFAMVETNLFMVSVKMPLALLLIVTAGIGFAAGLIASRWIIRKR